MSFCLLFPPFLLLPAPAVSSPWLKLTITTIIAIITTITITIWRGARRAAREQFTAPRGPGSSLHSGACNAIEVSDGVSVLSGAVWRGAARCGVAACAVAPPPVLSPWLACPRPVSVATM